MATPPDAQEATSFRDLYTTLLNTPDTPVYDTLLLPFLPRAQALLSHLAPFRQLATTPANEDQRRDGLHDLYALNRINDFLLLPFQNTPARQWTSTAITPDQYTAFFTAIGLDPFHPTPGQPLSPAHHEIFRVDPSPDDDEPITLLHTAWPGLRFGQLLFSRAGVHVRGGRRFIRKEVAESSTLYFTHRRLNRPCEDPSHGWGSNSQWRTFPRRDYETANHIYYNVDGDHPLTTPPAQPDRDGLTPHERLELCRHRCFILTPKPHAHLYPYDDRYDEPAP